MTNEPRPPDGAEKPLGPPPPPSPEPAADPDSYLESQAHQACPACGEWVPNEAFVCRTCRYDLRREAFADARPRTDGLAVASLIMGLVAVMIFPLIPLSALGGVLALVMGGVSKRQIRKSEGAMSGAEMARFGLLLGILALGLALGLTVAAYLLDIEVINVDLST